MQGATVSRLGLCVLLALSLVAVSPPVTADAGGSSWHWLSPLPRGETLNAVDIASADGQIAYAVGADGCAIKTYDGGANWVQKSCPVTVDLLDVSFVDSTHGWAVGQAGTILRMTDGASFQQQVAGTPDDVRGVYFRSTTLGWAITGTGTVLRTTDGGTTWNQVDLGDYYMNDVYFVTDTKGFAISGNGDIFVSTDGGATWPTHIDKGDSTSLDGICFDPDNAQVGWIASGNGVPWKTTDGGATWNTVAMPYHSFNSVACAGGGSNVVWLAGWNNQPNHIVKVQDSGTPTWEQLADSTYGNDPSFNGVDCSSGSQALAVGASSHVAFTTNGGTSWGHRSYTAPREYLTAIQFLDLRTGYVCAGNSVYKSTNAGATWTPTASAGATGVLYALSFLDANTGWAVGSSGQIFKTTNGGASWAKQTTGVTDELDAVYFTDSSHGWVVGDNGRMLWTTNGGTTWNAATLGADTLNDVDFCDANHGAIVNAAGVVYVTANGATDGGTWAPGGPTGTGGTLNLDAVDYAATNALYVGGARRTILAAGDATMLKSSDGGTAWNLVPGDLTKRNEFMSRSYVTDIAFSSATAGWVAFLDGSVAYTNDSGATWTYGTAMDTNMTSLSAVGGQYVWVCASNGRVASNYWYTPTVVYRFYNKVNGTHFYTSDVNEKHHIIDTWPDIYQFEGTGYEYDAMKANQPLYRFYNKVSGSHFYTCSEAEKATVIAKWPNVYTYEGPAYNVTTTPVGPSSTVYRFYNLKNGSHFYTASPEERDTVMQKWPTVYKYEGPAFYLPL